MIGEYGGSTRRCQPHARVVQAHGRHTECRGGGLDMFERGPGDEERRLFDHVQEMIECEAGLTVSDVIVDDLVAVDKEDLIRRRLGCGR